MEGTPLAQMAREQAENNALSYALMENVAAAHNVVLTDEDKAAMEEELAQMVEQAGSEEAFDQSLYETGLSRATHSRLSASNYLYQHLLELAQDPSSDIYKAPGEDNAYVDHILLATKNAETNEPLSDSRSLRMKSRRKKPWLKTCSPSCKPAMIWKTCLPSLPTPTARTPAGNPAPAI